MCCIAFLLELFKDYEVDVYFPDDRERFLEYYKSLYPDMKIEYKHTSTFTKDPYNLCLKVTSEDKIIPCDGIISIAHIKYWSDDHNKYIIMTPWIQGGSNLFYFFPLYRGLKQRSYKNVITYLGYMENRYLDEDTKNFIRSNPEYIFNFFGMNYIHELQQFSNVRFGGRIDTFTMANVIKESKFILARKTPYQLTDRYSGSLGHAVSHGKPMIIQKYSADSYKLPGVVFENNYCEVIDKIKNMTDEEYEEQVKQVEQFSEMTFKANKETLQKLLA